MKLLRSCKLNLLQWRINPKYLAIFLYMALYLWYVTHGYVDFCRDVDRSIRPWIFPLLPGTPGALITVYLGFVLLLSDAPFRSRQQQFVLQRVGKRIWAAGQLLYLFLACLVFTLLLWVLTWIFLLPRLEWGWDWGPVPTTVAASGISPEYGVWGLEYECMRNVAPLAATAWVFGMMVGVSFLLGEIMILCNLWLKKGIGLAVVTSFALLPFLVVITAHTPYAARKLLWISPLSWLNLSLMGQPNQGLPSYGFAVGVTVGLSVLLGILIVGTIHRCNLETEKE